MNSALLKSALHRLGASGLVLVAGLAFAKVSHPPPEPPRDSAPIPITQWPETCPAQCGVLEATCGETCEQVTSKKGKSMCEADCGRFAALCQGSCVTQGRIDADYIKAHITPPKASTSPRHQRSK